jgi:hypothetical protein
MRMRWMLLITVSLLFAGCFGSDCVNEVREELASPSGNFKAVVFSRNCGATTGANVQVSVLKMKEELPDTGGNTLIVDKGEATVSWKVDGGLLVVLDHRVRVFKKESVVDGVAIEYRDKYNR